MRSRPESAPAYQPRLWNENDDRKLVDTAERLGLERRAEIKFVLRRPWSLIKARVRKLQGKGAMTKPEEAAPGDAKTSERGAAQ